MKCFGRTKWALPKALEWCEREPEFEWRAGFACMVMVAMADKNASDATIRQFFPHMLRHANDDRQFVKKAINWALRTVGKRNSALHSEALTCAHEIAALGSKSTRWIASDAIRKLNVPGIKLRNFPKTQSLHAQPQTTIAPKMRNLVTELAHRFFISKITLHEGIEKPVCPDCTRSELADRIRTAKHPI